MPVCSALPFYVRSILFWAYDLVQCPSSPSCFLYSQSGTLPGTRYHSCSCALGTREKEAPAIDRRLVTPHYIRNWRHLSSWILLWLGPASGPFAACCKRPCALTLPSRSLSLLDLLAVSQHSCSYLASSRAVIRGKFIEVALILARLSRAPSATKWSLCRVASCPMCFTWGSAFAALVIDFPLIPA